MHGDGVGVSVHETEGVVVGCSGGMLFCKGFGALVGIYEENIVGAIVPLQVRHLTLKSSYIFVRRSISSEKQFPAKYEHKLC